MTSVKITERSEKLREKTPLCSSLATEHLLFELCKPKKPKYNNVRRNQLRKIIIPNKAVFLMKVFYSFLKYFFQKS